MIVGTKLKKIMSEAQNNTSHISSGQNALIAKRYSDLAISLPQVQKDKPALYIVSSEDGFQAIRDRLYRMYAHFDLVQIVELSFDSDISEIQEAVDNCILYSSHCMCLLSSGSAHLPAILNSYESLKEPSNLGNCSSDGREIIHENTFLHGLDEMLYLNNIIQIGLQLQETPSTFFDTMDKGHYEHYRIGNFKKEMKEVEPIMRDLNIFQFNCNSIRISDFPSKTDHNPSGFSAEEALQLIKYASLSPNLSFVLLHGMEIAQLESSAVEYLAQAIWYTTHGVDVRLDDSPYDLEKMQEYIVEHDYYDFPISFLKSKKSSRWWIKIPNTHEDQAPFVCISCSERDYLEVFENRVPYRLLKAIERNQ